jgi:hypothetical protein
LLDRDHADLAVVGVHRRDQDDVHQLEVALLRAERRERERDAGAEDGDVELEVAGIGRPSLRISG